MSERFASAYEQAGTLELRVKSNKVETATSWTNLRIPQSDAIDPAQQNEEKLHSTKVSVRGFQKFLTSHHVGGTAIACESVCCEQC